MPNPTDGAKGSVPPSGGRTRPAPTIDLSATEVESRPVAWAVSDDPAPDAGDEPPPDATDDQPPSPPPESDTPRRGAPVWLPVLLGLVSGAAGAGLVVLALWTSGWPVQTSDDGLADRLAKIESRLAEPRPPASPGADPAKLDDLSARLSKVEAAQQQPRPAATDPAVGNRLAAAEETLKSVNQSVADVGQQLEKIDGAQRELRERVDAHSTALAELARKAVQSGNVDRGDVEALANRIGALETADKTLKDDIAKVSDRPARLAVAAATLRSNVERGDGYAAELAAVKSLGAQADTLAPLEPFAASGLPAPAALGREFAALAPEMTRLAGNASSEGDSFLDKLQANAEKLVRIRPVDAPAGDDPRSIIARAARLAPTDPAAARAEIAKLPAAIRAPASAWAAKVEQRQAALDAARRTADQAAAALSRAPS